MHVNMTFKVTVRLSTWISVYSVNGVRDGWRLLRQQRSDSANPFLFFVEEGADHTVSNFAILLFGAEVSILCLLSSQHRQHSHPSLRHGREPHITTPDNLGIVSQQWLTSSNSEWTSFFVKAFAKDADNIPLTRNMHTSHSLQVNQALITYRVQKLYKYCWTVWLNAQQLGIGQRQLDS